MAFTVRFSYLFSSFYSECDVTQSQGFLTRISETDVLQWDMTLIRPGVRRNHICHPGGLLVKMIVLNNSLHWCHLQEHNFTSLKTTHWSQLTLISKFDITKNYSLLILSVKKYTYPSNTIYWPKVVMMMFHHPPRWLNITATFKQCLYLQHIWVC